MSFTINQNFDLKSRVKDFTRQELKLIDLPNTRDADYPDDYLIAIDGKLYIFNSNNEIDPTTGKWREFQSGLQSVSQATSSTLGGIKIGFPENNDDRNYPVELNGIGQAYVNVPWTDANTTYGLANSSSDGLMSSDMFNKLDGIAAGATKITVDNALSSTSQNPVQNNVINSALDGKSPVNHTHTASDITSGLATVATSGSYNDLSNKPAAYSLPTATSSILGGIKVGAGLSITDEGILSATGGGVADSVEWDNIAGKPDTFTPSSHTHSIDNINGLQDALDGKQAAGNYAASNHTHPLSQITEIKNLVVKLNNGSEEDTSQFTYDGSAAKTVNITPSGIGAATSSHTHAASQVTGLTASRALVSDSSGHPTVSAVTSTELGYLDGVTSSIQTQLNGKAASSHSHTINQISDLQSTLDGKAATNHSHDNASSSTAGFMSTDDKNKLDNITDSADSVSFSRTLSTGTNIGTITINGEDTIIYAPTAGESVTYEQATDTTLGLVKIGASKLEDKQYAIQLNSSGQMFVDVPWTDNNTTYSAGTGLSLSDNTFSIKTEYATDNEAKNYKVTTDENGNLYVNVPWSDTNTTYSTATDSIEGLVKIGFPESGKNYPIELNDNGQMFVNVPWTDTVPDFKLYIYKDDTYSELGSTSSSCYVGTPAIGLNNVNPVKLVTNSDDSNGSNASFSPCGNSNDPYIQLNLLNATTNAAGLMSSADKTKLDEITTITDEQINDICV